MPILDHLRRGVGSNTLPNEAQTTSTTHDAEIQRVAETITGEKGTEAAAYPDGAPPEKDLDDLAPNQDTQLGVQQIEAVTLVWTKKWLAALLFKYVLPRGVCRPRAPF